MMNRGGRLELVKSTLLSIPVHAMLSLDLDAKTVEQLMAVCRGFLWKGRKEIKGGHCLVAWKKADSPKEVGGLGVPNLKYLNLALRCRWAWLQRTDPSKP